MSITEPQRLALHTAARTALGDEEGDALMAALPPSNTEIATRQDVEHLADATRGDLARVETGLRGDMQNLETCLRGDMQNLETSLRGEIREVAGRLKPLEDRVGARITKASDDLRDELTRRIHRSELRTMGVIVLAFVADRALG